MLEEQQYKFFGVKEEVAEAYAASLREHIAYVREAGRKLGVSDTQLELHDKSKWSIHEFPGYAVHFKGGGAPDEFAAAWLHHLHHNPHHWQHWLFPDGQTQPGSSVVNGVMKMPPKFAVEMVADWMGASRAYTGSWDMTNWLVGHTSKMKLHPQTAHFVTGVLSDLGYGLLLRENPFPDITS